jgi:murein DD-endopeptidase MepM/ murein hydrolase activator NlpD
VKLTALALTLAAISLVAWLVLAPGAAAAWRRPVGGPLLRAFAVSPDRYERGQHRGVDLAAPPGAPVRAACAGRVRFAGRVPGGGLTVSVVCGRLVATYQHLGALATPRGAGVLTGALLGSVGRSGLPPGVRAHLHLGARELASGRYVDPLALFGAAPRATPPVGRAPRPAPPELPRRRALGPLRPAPREPARRPTLGPLRQAPPAPARRPALVPEPLGRGFEPRSAPAEQPSLVVWAGLAAFALGLPLGGLVRLRRRRRAAQSGGARARRWAAAHR